MNPFLNHIKRAALGLSLLGLAFQVSAQTRVDDAWVRATVPNQPATGAFMRLNSPTDTRLVAAQTPAAAVTEIHEMRMDNDVMRMRQVQAVELPAGETVELKPGGYHLMMMQLKDTVTAGTQVPLTLTFEDAQGQRDTVEIQVPVRALGATGGHGGHGSHGAASKGHAGH